MTPPEDSATRTIAGFLLALNKKTSRYNTGANNANIAHDPLRTAYLLGRQSACLALERQLLTHLVDGKFNAAQDLVADENGAAHKAKRKAERQKEAL